MSRGLELAQLQLEPVEDGLDRVLTNPRAHTLHLALLELLPGSGATPLVLASARRKLLEGTPEPLSTQEKTAALLDAETLTQARSRYAVRFI
ncbi:hypothetical protein F0U59_24500 [Archangium gephyra]|nr:hypothetical protein F0U59_24500 [Archangium gephyra]